MIVLPDCPTCGGRGHGREHWDDDLGNVAIDCPDCIDGKVSIERLVAVFNAVMDEEFDEDTTDSRRCAFLYLRGVR